MDSLEPNGEVVNHDEECGTQASTKESARPNSSVQEDARRNGGLFSQPDLNHEEANDEHTKDNKQANDAAILPGILGTTPLQSQQQRHNTGDEQEGTEQIERLDLLLEAQLALGNLGLRQAQEGNDECNGNTTKGQVNVEAPSPSDVIGKGTAHKRSSNRGNTVHGPNDAHVHGTLAQRHGSVDNQQGTGEYTSSAKSGDGSAENKAHGVWRGTADEGADLKQEDGEEIDPFYGVEGVEFTKDELDGACGEEIGRTVPADIFESLELIGDSRNGGRDNGVVLGSLLVDVTEI